ncbi:hypothetical protein [Solibacillus sp. FSL K6-1523]|uniref:hypothetical protein n=1 Tax=Solibacillus sp. FSL K6-1523 TaxID=2921471 RepID=UPI0030F6959E
MKKREFWDENQIEKLLEKAPKITDERSKDEVLQRLKESAVFDSHTEKQPIKMKKKMSWKPLIASIASLFVLVFIASTFMGNAPEISLPSDTEDAQLEDTSSHEPATTRMMESHSVDMENDTLSPKMAATPIQTVVNEQQLQGFTLFTIGLAGDDAESVPVSFLIPNEIVERQLGTKTPTKLQLYQEFAPFIEEQSLGFKEYHPIKGSFTEKGDDLVHQLPDDHTYDIGSAALSNYVGALIDTFGESYNRVLLTNAEGTQMTLNHMGEINNPIELTGKMTHYNYFSYQMRDGSTYLSPNFRMSFSNVKDALLNMTTEANDIFHTAILPDVSFQVKVKKNIVIVTFDELLDLENYDSTQAMRMIEGILLTAASFNKEVKFEQIKQQDWGGFHFSKPLPKPVAANLVVYDFSAIE